MVNKVIGYVWFTGRSNIGIIVVGNSDLDIQKAYISTVSGIDQNNDLNYIKDFGTRFPITEARSLIEKNGFISDRKAWDKFKG